MSQDTEGQEMAEARIVPAGDLLLFLADIGLASTRAFQVLTQGRVNGDLCS